MIMILRGPSPEMSTESGKKSSSGEMSFSSIKHYLKLDLLLDFSLKEANTFSFLFKPV